jgi:26S proteasome regulatory subunit N12
MYSILGLNLLNLLSQNRISEFHTEVELLDPKLLSTNIYIKHPIQVEQCIMEGSYNKVWNSRGNVPMAEYSIFMDILVDTIRNEIADCSEKAYDCLPVNDACTLLYFKNGLEINEFCKIVSY